ncbi:hypothetical protein AA106555_0798 [Neokomagataea thailandica NBRC 106555]|uniref:DUF1489 family protein n=2 Tax=Neokomagataea TaxID=1223423 RepID=A0A4Y6V4T9_9PROT|nr:MULTISPECIES: DUF1489 domain-containing protein [Neokomagataea]QDH25122.1 DUF1489 family protein [Neokomagataea tanensis]GBR52094.1 hypothetical protein AA106555_0798 [Neokomagataea thailandica NBRC 106555]
MLHMIKLAVGCPTIDALKERMKSPRFRGYGAITTRTMPKRADEILDGGSLYRVLNGLILCRQPIVGLEPYERQDGSTGTLILVSDDIIPVQARAMRPFQGWRYLKAEDAPADLGAISDGIAELPPRLHRILSELALC